MIRWTLVVATAFGPVLAPAEPPLDPPVGSALGAAVGSAPGPAVGSALASAEIPTPVTAIGEGERWPTQNEAREETTRVRETFLRTAEIVARQTADVGITRPERIELEQDGLRRRAMFKSLDTTFASPIRIGSEVRPGVRDSWKFELAAYELDKLLGLDLVPVTVPRTIDGREGALIDWVDAALPPFGASAEAFDVMRWQDIVETVWLFDYLAFNVDRSPENLLVTPGFGVKLIDHSRAFQLFLTPMRPLARFPRAAIENLRQATDGEMKERFDPFLTDDEVEALLERKRRVLALVDALLADLPESEVFF